MIQKKLVSLTLVLFLALSTFGLGVMAEEQKAYEIAMEQFPLSVNREDAEAIEGGIMRFALVASSAFAGTLNHTFYEDQLDYQILRWFSESFLSMDENFVYDQDGAATYEYDKDAKTITLTLNEGITWHDGEPVTLDDLVFAYEVICHPDYIGIRYDDKLRNVVGVEEYHDGKAETISGLVLSEDEMQLTLQLKELNPGTFVGGLWAYGIPRHYFEGVEVKDMKSHPKSRETPIGFGPFKIKNIVPGEAVEFVRFDEYWRGTPKLDGVTVNVINPDLVPEAMKQGQFDVAEFSTQNYPDYMEPTNYQYLGQLATVFNYTGFKLGTWDFEKNDNIYNPDSKMANVNLRQAIGYAVDNQALAETLYNGLRFLSTTAITPRHSAYQNNDLEGYVYNPELSKQLLDEAGYIDVDGDGFREDPNGEPLVITWASMEGQGSDTITNFKMQAWKDVGLNVVLYQDRPTEFNAFYEAVENDDPAIDMYDGAWQTGSDPNPHNLWGPKANANYTRYTSEALNKVIEEISSENAWDPEFLSAKYHEFQQIFFDEAPAIPTMWRMELFAVNDRVKFYDLVSPDESRIQHLFELSAEEPAK